MGKALINRAASRLLAMRCVVRAYYMEGAKVLPAIARVPSQSVSFLKDRRP